MSKRRPLPAKAGLIVALLACVVLSVLFWVKKPSYFATPPVGTAYLFFRDGRVSTVAESALPQDEWKTFHPKPLAKPPWWKAVILKIWPSGLMPIPNPPRAIDLKGNMAPCATWLGKPIHVHSDFLGNKNNGWVSYTYGGRHDARTAKAWISANLEGIRTNGITFVFKASQSNIQAVIVVSSESVRIMPESRLVAKEP